MSVTKTRPVKDFRKEIPGEIDHDDTTTYKFPEIIGKNKHGTKTHWQIIVRLYDRKTDKFIEIRDEYYNGKQQLPAEIVGWMKVISKTGESSKTGKIGKVRDTVPTIVESGKNLTKENETNVFTQALRDAYGKYMTQTQKSGLNDIMYEGVKLYPPMLAQNKESQKKQPDYSANIYIQPKYNGVRVVSTADNSGGIIMYSRKMKLYYGFSYIRDEISKIIDWFDQKHDMKIYIDGEIYYPEMSLQKISGIVRKETQESDIRLNYYVFDCFFPDKPDMLYSERLMFMEKIKAHFGDKLHYVKFTPTDQVKSEEEAQIMFRKYLKDGLEGAIMRLDGKYEYSYNEYHSSVLLKMKPVLDDEFDIIGYEAAEKGKSKGVLKFILQTKEGKVFPINIGMPIPELKEMYKMMPKIEKNGKTYFENHFKGKKLNVKFDEWSDDRLPLRPRTEGIVLRDYE